MIYYPDKVNNSLAMLCKICANFGTCVDTQGAKYRIATIRLLEPRIIS